MSDARERRKFFFANKMHRDLFVIIFCAAVIPTVITAILMYYLIFYITSREIGIPETIAAHLIPAARQVTVILWLMVPSVIAIILYIAHKIAHQILGPFDRIVRELDKFISGTGSGKIILRDNDKFQPLVDRINILLERLRP